ncbi:hypothetical protein M0R45_012371 [Rubus argutus]|uniref:Uncharacterized protein n=1 Tax=Rubus argutus TaxID=59490 RepID=A0AAW1YDE8_RUBAR
MYDDADNCDDWRCSPWNNPVLYLAAAFVAVFLVLRLGLAIWIFCEKRRQSMDHQHDHISSSASQDLEAVTTTNHQRAWELECINGGSEASNGKQAKVSDDKVLVIMAGNDKPTFLATPV